MTTTPTDSDRRLPWHVDTPPIRRWIARLEAEGAGDEAWEKVAAWDRMVEQDGVVKIERRDRVGMITLSYPQKGNALVPPMYRMLVDAVRELDEDDDVWVILITGAGKNFSTGGYVGDDAFYAGLDAGKDGTVPEPMRRTFVEMFQPVPLAVHEAETPTIAAVNGLVMAEAVDLASAADLRTGHPGTEFRFSFARTGNTAYTGAGWLLPRIVGYGRAHELLLTAATVDGERAHEIGLVNFLYDTDNFLDDSLALAAHIASLPPITLRLIKKELKLGQEVDSLSSALGMTSMIEPIVQFTQDHMDAEQAVIEKRPPVVRGK